MLVTPDLSEVTAPIIPGTYSARIVGVEAKETNFGDDSRQPVQYLRWDLELFGDEKWNGRKIKHDTFTAGKAAFKLQQLFAAATGEVLDKGTTFDTDQLNGREIAVVVTDTNWKGEKTRFPEVASVAALG